MKPLFSILHTSARPAKWRAVFDDWMQKAVRPETVEYVLCADPRWGFPLDPEDEMYCVTGIHQPGIFRVVLNTGRRCYVDGVNIAAKASTGSILIVNADDQFACEGWDQKLIGKMERLVGSAISAVLNLPHDGNAQKSLQTFWPKSFVIEVSTGTPNEHDRKIMVMPILARTRYEEQGCEVFYHGYESMCADNDFCEHALQDAVVVDARDLMFPHRHPMIDSHTGGWVAAVSDKDWDQPYRWQNREEASKAGMALLQRRRAAKFEASKRSIAMCYPGDDFRGRMVDALMNLYAHLIERDFTVLRMRSDSPNVYQVREEIRRELWEQKERPDLILWMDHDNPLGPDQFDQLLTDLEAHPEVDGVAGWCWIYDRIRKTGFAPSCGLWAPDHLQWQPFPPSFSRERELKPFECGGLPCILMRLSALEKAGESPFLPIRDKRLELGILGEDFCFFRAAEEGGAQWLVDPKVRVPHLKYVDVEPVFPDEGAPEPVKVACMMRVKNEDRWIKRVIDSVRPLCGDDIFVMEDGSSDDTAAVIEAAGVHILRSPFSGFDERRDKNWLLGQVKHVCPHADWILMPDGDEELEPEGPAKIRRVLEANPNVDVFALRVLNLWDSVDTIRIDGSYGRMARQSLFRTDTELVFKSYYEGEGANTNHVGLHVSNAPGVQQDCRLAPLNVCLLHYGPLHREDRIRKYRWITKLDPHNEHEDFYRHMVQGDLPEFPAEATYKHGGPLEVRKLPRHLIPKWAWAPGPLVSSDAEEDRKLANAGLEEYAAVLAGEDSGN